MSSSAFAFGILGNRVCLYLFVSMLRCIWPLAKWFSYMYLCILFRFFFPFGYYKILSIVSCSIKLYLYNDILLCHKKEWNRVTDRTWMGLEVILTEKARRRNTNIIWYHLYLKSKKKKKTNELRCKTEIGLCTCMLSHFSWICLFATV